MMGRLRERKTDWEADEQKAKWRDSDRESEDGVNYPEKEAQIEALWGGGC